jgi:hypothetical protein
VWQPRTWARIGFSNQILRCFKCLRYIRQPFPAASRIKTASDEERQHLLSFVARLACADTAKVEWEREVYIALRMRCHRKFPERLKILEGALAIGRRADEPAPEEVRARLDAVQQSAKALSSVADSPNFTKIKAWLAPTL